MKDVGKEIKFMDMDEVTVLFFCIWMTGTLNLMLSSLMHSVRASIFRISIIYH
jgi:hypothetical protein